MVDPVNKINVRENRRGNQEYGQTRETGNIGSGTQDTG